MESENSLLHTIVPAFAFPSLKGKTYIFVFCIICFQFNHSIFSCGCLIPESQEEWRCWLWHVCPVPNSHLWKHTDQVLIQQFSFASYWQCDTVVHLVSHVPSLAISILGVGFKFSGPPSLRIFHVSHVSFKLPAAAILQLSHHHPHTLQSHSAQCYKTADFLHMFVCCFSRLLWVAVLVINTLWLSILAPFGSCCDCGGGDKGDSRKGKV